MINLLPLNEKMKVRSEYRLRFYTVSGIMLLVLIVSIFIPLIISYFAISYDVQFIADVADNMSKSESFKKTDAIATTIKDTNRKLILLNNPFGITVRQDLVGAFSFIFTTADNVKNNNKIAIQITEMSYDQGVNKIVSSAVATSTPDTVKESGIHKIRVRGFADSRENMTSFVRMLEADKNFSNVDSPISNLVNSVNIDFMLTITLRDKAV